MSGPWTTTVTAFTVTRRGPDWLMVRHERLGVTSWELPGGHVDGGEGLEEAAARETLEEAGVAVEVGSLLATCVHEWHERRARKLICFFDAVAQPGSAPAVPYDEPDIHEVAWIDPLELPPDDVSPFLLPLVEQQRQGWREAPTHFRMTHRRNGAGLWVPAPA